MLGIIGGTGLDEYEGLVVLAERAVMTPFGSPSAPVLEATLDGRPVCFVARHGSGHRIPPHRINYRANLWALRECGVDDVIAVAAVGGITGPMTAGTVVIPDQVVDYTWGREHTLFDGVGSGLEHVDFTFPYCESMRARLIDSARSRSVSEPVLPVHVGGTYGATQGPRLESAAEIDRMERDGCDIVGMTGMPETILARELSLCYACCALVVNAAAGRGDGLITMDEISRNLHAGMGRVRRLIEQTVRAM